MKSTSKHRNINSYDQRIQDVAEQQRDQQMTNTIANEKLLKKSNHYQASQINKLKQQQQRQQQQYQPDLESMFYANMHVQMTENNPVSLADQLLVDEDDTAGYINVQKSARHTTTTRKKREVPHHHIDEIEESGQFDNTKIIMPKQKINDKSKMIGDYQIEKTLGQGTFGKVKQGYHIYTGQKVAIKILDKWKIEDINDIERVAREIHILKIVRHPCIIQIYEIIETPNRLFLIMEHCCNGELFNYITSKNRLKEDEACRLFQQLISGIDYLGELGIAHRDIKPENLLLDAQKNLKIVDFGLSNTFKDNEKLVTACGSPCYAAPELIKGLEYVGPKADIWSAGVVLYCLVCGHLPFEDQNTQSLYQKILSANYQFTCYLSQEVQNLVEHILVPEPGLRYSLKQIKQNVWFQSYKPPIPISNCSEKIRVHKKLLKEMKEQCPEIDISFVRCCLEANVKNSLTAHYQLLLKKKTILGESISEFSQLDILDADADYQIAKRKNDLIMPNSEQVKAHHSIPAAPRTNLNNIDKIRNQQARYGYQLKKMGEGIHNINIINQNQDVANQQIPTPRRVVQDAPKLSQKQQQKKNQRGHQYKIYSPDQLTNQKVPVTNDYNHQPQQQKPNTKPPSQLKKYSPNKQSRKIVQSSLVGSQIVNQEQPMSNRKKTRQYASVNYQTIQDNSKPQLKAVNNASIDINSSLNDFKQSVTLTQPLKQKPKNKKMSQDRFKNDYVSTRPVQGQQKIEMINQHMQQPQTKRKFINTTEHSNYKTITNGPVRQKQAQSIVTNNTSNFQRDQLNITNSLIISNSQILVQDLGNGKIVPVQLGPTMSTIQTGGYNQKQTHQRQNSNQPDKEATSLNRQTRRKTAQSTRFNTLMQDYTNNSSIQNHTQKINHQLRNSRKAAIRASTQMSENQNLMVDPALFFSQKGSQGMIASNGNFVSQPSKKQRIPERNAKKKISMSQTGNAKTIQQNVTSNKIPLNNNSKELFQKRDIFGNNLTVNPAILGNNAARKTTRVVPNNLNAQNQSRNANTTQITQQRPKRISGSVNYNGTQDIKSAVQNSKMEGKGESGPNSQFLNQVNVKNQLNIQQNITQIANKISQIKVQQPQQRQVYLGQNSNYNQGAKSMHRSIDFNGQQSTDQDHMRQQIKNNFLVDDSQLQYQKRELIMKNPAAAAYTRKHNYLSNSINIHENPSQQIMKQNHAGDYNN